MAPVSSAILPLTTSIEPEPSLRCITSFLLASKRPTTVTLPSDLMLEISTGSPGVVTVLTPSRKTTTLLAWLMLMDILPWYSFTDTPSSLTTAPGARFGLLPQSLYSHLVLSPPSDHGWSSIKPYGTIFSSPLTIVVRGL